MLGQSNFSAITAEYESQLADRTSNQPSDRQSGGNITRLAGPQAYRRQPCFGMSLSALMIQRTELRWIVVAGNSKLGEGGRALQNNSVEYRPSTKIYIRFNYWSRRGFWLKLLDALVDNGALTRSIAIDGTYIKAQRAAFG